MAGAWFHPEQMRSNGATGAKRPAGGARELLLVRHAPTVPVSGVKASEWALAPGALAEARRLGEELLALLASRGAQPPARLVSSYEPKAELTAEALAEVFGVERTVADGLEEHHRPERNLLAKSDWLALIKRFFEQPEDVLFGLESALEARRRISAAVAASAEGAEGGVAIVTHGTVLTLLLAEPNSLDPFDLWRSLRMPEAFLVSWPKLRIMGRV